MFYDEGVTLWIVILKPLCSILTFLLPQFERESALDSGTTPLFTAFRHDSETSANKGAKSYGGPSIWDKGSWHSLHLPSQCFCKMWWRPFSLFIHHLCETMTAFWEHVVLRHRDGPFYLFIILWCHIIVPSSLASQSSCITASKMEADKVSKACNATSCHNFVNCELPKLWSIVE